MVKVNHKTLINLSGAIWFGIGLWLLYLGIHFLVNSDIETNILLMMIVVALFIGYMKGKFILTKSANRCINRISNLPNPANLHQLYSRNYYLLLGSMIALGISMKFLGLPTHIRGFVDVAIGSALINGSMTYFRVTNFLTI